ncbi:protein phosphatase 2C domain-containing protein [soil metagenome]
MLVTCTTLSLPKDGNAQDEYEDAAYPLSFSDTDDQTEFRCAVADGATETSFSGLWANLLVRGYVDEEPLEESRKKWKAAIPSEDQPWYVEEKAQAGAYAALVGLSIHADGTWDCEAVGDSCLVHIRDNKMLQSFPLTSAEEFNNSPSLICSLENPTANVEFSNLKGDWQAGDKFLLMTDAISRWVLDQAAVELNRVCDLENEADLREFSNQQRAILGEDGRSRLHNDDVTIMKVDVN